VIETVYLSAGFLGPLSVSQATPRLTDDVLPLKGIPSDGCGSIPLFFTTLLEAGIIAGYLRQIHCQ
jgi:hypothetical protein